MAGILKTGHRGRGAGIDLDLVPQLEQAISLYKHRGKTWYVDSSVSGGNGSSWESAYDTLSEAVAASAANDLILVAPDHAETIAAALSINKAGLRIIGIGHGASRPTFTFSAVASSFDIDADSVVLANLLGLTTAECTIVVDVNDTDALLADLELRYGSDSPLIWIDINGGAANACDRTRVIGSTINGTTDTAATAGIELGEVADGVVISDCHIFGDFSDACIHNPTSKVLTNLLIADSLLTNLQSGDHSIELVSACTGSLVRNLYHNNMTQATGVDPGACRSFECYHDDAVDVSGILAPVVT